MPSAGSWESNAHHKDAAILRAQPHDAVASLTASSHRAERAHAVAPRRQTEHHAVAAHVMRHHLVLAEGEAEPTARIERDGNNRRRVHPPPRRLMRAPLGPA